VTLFGWDASDFDHSRGPMDMQSARDAGISFYTHKLSEGTSVRHNPGPSCAGARTAGIPFIGVYVVPRTAPTVAAQVAYALNAAADMVPWWPDFDGWFWQVDTEHWSYDQVSAQRGHDVAQELARQTGRAVLHYAPQWAYGNSVPAGEPLWASSYVAGSGSFAKLYPGDGAAVWAPYSGRVPAVLQYSSSATIGRQSGCDANAFRGDRAAFAAMIEGGSMSSSNTDAFVDAYRQGINHAADGKPVAPVDWRVRDEAWQAATANTLAAILAAVGDVGHPTLTDDQVALFATTVADKVIANPGNSLTPADHAAIVEDFKTVAAQLQLHLTVGS
jgi:hypothetical protein